MKNLIILLSLTLISELASAHSIVDILPETAVTFKEPIFKNKAIGIAYTHYINLKNALVESDEAIAKTESDNLVKALESIEGAAKLLDEAKKVANSSSLKDQRTAFTALSNEMTLLIKKSELTGGELYLEYCPMANGNEGGYWLSNENEIRNPYFGSMMLKCGSVKEVIN
jgi:hypothetical protein